MLSYFKFSKAKKGSVGLRKAKIIQDKASFKIFDDLKVEGNLPALCRLNSPVNLYTKGCTLTSLLAFYSPVTDVVHRE